MKLENLPFLIDAIKQKLKTETKGFFDSTMAGLANNFAIACPGCKRADTPWDPAPEKKPRQLKQKSESALI